jgi:hypothetical protein
MAIPFYWPWVGANFAKSRTLILSESAYDWEEDGVACQPTPDHPSVCVNWAVEKFDEVPGTNYFGKMTRALSGLENPNVKERRDAWNGYAYSIYVSGSVGAGAGKRPTTTMWAAAEAGFTDLIAKIRPEPHKIIVTGGDMWKNMPECQAMLTSELQAFALPADRGTRLIWALALPHPSNRTEGFYWPDIAQRIAIFKEASFPADLPPLHQRG